ncbi:phosphopantetheine-binding protein [Hymenobacter cavernae]|uniref:Acyl carrier protein n=1 Tax=Hymenobacter cavernae TaxID=2044852 RepID=A0ABQ1TUT7_9BACT|nr:phosphopantetheine-binding protein [Hymenobacter cavernae]GGF03892.1 acyl carrier protein [Hymenobacter cavernae]
MSTLTEQLKNQIIQELNLVDINPADVNPDAPLFDYDGLGLDSIDALELTVILSKHYGIKVTDPAKMKQAFFSLNTLADFITEHQAAAVAA